MFFVNFWLKVNKKHILGQNRFYTSERVKIPNFLGEDTFVEDDLYLKKEKGFKQKWKFIEENKKKKMVANNEAYLKTQITDDFNINNKAQLWKAAYNEKQAERLGMLLFGAMTCFLSYFGWWLILAIYYHRSTSIMGYEKEEIWDPDDDENNLNVLGGFTNNLEDVIESGNSENWRADAFIQDYEQDELTPSINALARFSKTELFAIQGPLQWRDRIYNQIFRPLPFYSVFIKYLWRKNHLSNDFFFTDIYKIFDLNLIIWDLNLHTKYQKKWEYYSELIKKKEKKTKKIHEEHIKNIILSEYEVKKKKVIINIKNRQQQELELNEDFIWGVFGIECYDFMNNFENDFYPVLMYHDFIRRDFGLNLRENNKVIDDPFLSLLFRDFNHFDILYEKQKYYGFSTIPKKRIKPKLQLNKFKIYDNFVYTTNPYDSYMNLSFLPLPRNQK